MDEKCTAKHDLIMCSLRDTESLRDLAGKTKLPSAINLKYGTHIVLLVSWLKQKIELGSQDILNLMQDSPRDKSTARALWEIAKRDTVYERQTMVFGGNLILPAKDKIRLKDVTTVLQLLDSAHPIQVYLENICKKHFTVNYLDYRGLAELIALIDFPIPSIAALIKCLGYTYIEDNPYLGKGVIIGVSDAKQHTVCVYYDKGKFKVMPMQTLGYLASRDALDAPLTSYEAYQLQVYTNHMKETV